MNDTGYLSAIDQSFSKKKDKKVKKGAKSSCSPSFTTHVEKISMKEDKDVKKKIKGKRTLQDIFF